MFLGWPHCYACILVMRVMEMPMVALGRLELVLTLEPFYEIEGSRRHTCVRLHRGSARKLAPKAIP